MQYTPLDALQSQYDVVVIGSGLGGMTCAHRLAEAGHSVLLLEHHIQLGGLATWFKRGSHIFDVSLHGFPYGMVKTCKKYWGRTIRDSIVQLRQIVFDNPQFSLTTTFSKIDFIRILQERFGVARNVVEEFFATFGAMNFYDDQRLTTRELFAQFFPGRDFTGKKLRELTVHHKDHNSNNNPPDGSNWEMLCLYCHDNEHSRDLDAQWLATEDPDRKKGPTATHNPFAKLAHLLNTPEGDKGKDGKE